MKVKEKSEKIGLKLNIQKTKIMAPSPITSLQIDEETMETVRDFIFWGSKITADGECSREIKRHCFYCFPIYSHEVMGPAAMIFVFWMLSFKPAFSFSSFTFIKRLFSSSLLFAIRVVSSAYLRLFAGGQREEFRPWQRSWGRRLGIRKGVIKPQETPCSRASSPKTRVCFMLSPTLLTLRGALPHNRFSRRRSKRAAPRQ